MTEEEKRRDRDLKHEVTSWLNNNLVVGNYHYALAETDQRLEDYVNGIISSPERHNLYEMLSVRRFFSLLDKYSWNARRVQRFFRFYESVKLSGTSGRRTYRLTPIQCFQYASIFGLVKENGTRLTRTAYIFVPRKFSKTAGAAVLAVYDMLFGDSNAQAYVAANSYNQSKICFNEIRGIMRGLDPLEKHFRINREMVAFRNGERDSFAQCLTSNAKTQDGLFASLVILDEYAQARNTANRNGADLRNVLTTSMGPRKEPLTVVITTASDVMDGPFVHELDGVKKVLRGEAESETVFASLFMPDVDDKEDDHVTWQKVQPHLGITVQPDFYENEWATAQLSAENMLAFRTKLLNVFSVNEKNSWLTSEKAKELCGNFDIDKVKGHPDCAVAFDLSVRDDFSAVAYTLYSSASKRFYSHIDYYFPEGALKGHPNEHLYRLWNNEGHLILCDGDKIDVRRIAEDIVRRSKIVNIIRIGYDSYKSQELVNILSTIGARDVLMPYSQTYGSFNLPVESFEMLAYDNPPKITINDNPINVYCFTNCLIDSDRLENKKPVKMAQYRKIDGVITLLMTLGLLYSFER